MKRAVLAGLLAACAVLAAGAQERITVAASSSLESSGFLGYIEPLAQKQAGLAIRWITAEDAQVIELARECGADAILVSAPEAEDRLVRDGVGALRLRVMTAGAQKQFDAIAINPSACRSTRLDAALKFLRWITSKDGQSAVAEFFPRHGTVSYLPNAGTETCPACEAQQ
jgi:ABC-type tungstate transport system permease subunit